MKSVAKPKIKKQKIIHRRTNSGHIQEEIIDDNEEEEDYENEDFDLPEGVERIEKQEKVITENGNKKKIVKTVYYNSNGTQNIKTVKKDIYE